MSPPWRSTVFISAVISFNMGLHSVNVSYSLHTNSHSELSEPLSYNCGMNVTLSLQLHDKTYWTDTHQIHTAENTALFFYIIYGLKLLKVCFYCHKAVHTSLKSINKHEQWTMLFITSVRLPAAHSHVPTQLPLHAQITCYAQHSLPPHTQI